MHKQHHHRCQRTLRKTFATIYRCLVWRVEASCEYLKHSTKKRRWPEMPRWDETLSTRPDRMKRLVRFASEQPITQITPANVFNGHGTGDGNNATEDTETTELFLN